MSRRLMVGVMGAATLALLAAGCGGSDGPTKAEYVKEASAICKQRVKQTGNEFKAALDRKGSSPKAAAAQAIHSNLLKEVEELERLEVPEGDEEEIEAMLLSMRNGLEEAEEGQGNGLFSLDNQLRDASRAAQEYGLEHCASLL